MDKDEHGFLATKRREATKTEFQGSYGGQARTT